MNRLDELLKKENLTADEREEAYRLWCEKKGYRYTKGESSEPAE